MNLLARNLEGLCRRLDNSPANGTWLAHEAYSPASWLANNLT